MRRYDTHRETGNGLTFDSPEPEGTSSRLRSGVLVAPRVYSVPLIVELPIGGSFGEMFGRTSMIEPPEPIKCETKQRGESRP
jgi:hypothetical protein